MAIERARRDDLELPDDHLAIIRYLRDCYAGHGGHKFLYSLLPLGPITQASHYAGLPPGTHDLSFGTTR